MQNEIDKNFFSYIEKGDLDSVRSAIDAGTPVNEFDERGYSPLHVALIADVPKELIDLLIARGADTQARARSRGRSSSIHMAATNGNTSHAKRLIETGVDVNARNQGGRTSLHEAAKWGHLDMVRYLLENEANPNAKDDDGLSPLHEAAVHADPAIAALLIEKGADLNTGTSTGITPLHRAAVRSNCSKTVELLVNSGASIDVCSQGGGTPIDRARDHGCAANARFLERALRARSGASPLPGRSR